MRVVADTSLLNYLALIGSVAILPAMFAAVLIPVGVERELTDPFAPDEVRRLMRSAPLWLTVRQCPADPDSSLAHLDDGEREAVLLARALDVDLMLMDDRAGVVAARAAGVPVTGTLGLLDRAARLGLLDIAAVVERLEATSFRCRPALLQELLASHRGE